MVASCNKMTIFLIWPAPCVRRVINFIQFENTVKPTVNVRATGTSQRHCIDFDIASGDQSTEDVKQTSSTMSVALHIGILSLCFHHQPNTD